MLRTWIDFSLFQIKRKKISKKKIRKNVKTEQKNLTIKAIEPSDFLFSCVNKNVTVQNKMKFTLKKDYFNENEI